MYTRGGLGQSNVNPTTIWTPSTGFLSQTGNINSGTTPPVFVAPVQTAAPACSSGPAATADSAACIAQLLANQQQNMNAQNAANYDYDLETCEANYNENIAPDQADGITPGANTCSTDTFGLTPTVSGGYSGSGVLGSVAPPVVVAPVITPTVTVSTPANQTPATTTTDPSGNTCATSALVAGYCPASGTVPMTTDPSGASCPTSSLVSGYCPASTASNYVDQAESFFTEPVSVAGTSFPVWELVAAGVAALVFLPKLLGGRH